MLSAALQTFIDNIWIIVGLALAISIVQTVFENAFNLAKDRKIKQLSARVTSLESELAEHVTKPIPYYRRENIGQFRHPVDQQA